MLQKNAPFNIEAIVNAKGDNLHKNQTLHQQSW